MTGCGCPRHQRVRNAVIGLQTAFSWSWTLPALHPMHGSCGRRSGISDSQNLRPRCHPVFCDSLCASPEWSDLPNGISAKDNLPEVVDDPARPVLGLVRRSFAFPVAPNGILGVVGVTSNFLSLEHQLSNLDGSSPICAP